MDQETLWKREQKNCKSQNARESSGRQTLPEMAAQTRLKMAMNVFMCKGEIL